MNRAYDLFVFLHILAVVVGFGPGVATAIIGARAAKAPAPARLALGQTAAVLGQFVIMPGAVVVLVTGILAAYQADYDLEPSWVKTGIVLWLLVGMLGGFLNANNRRMVRVQQAAPGPPSDADVATLERLGRRQQLMGMAANLLVAAAVFVMVWKPGA